MMCFPSVHDDEARFLADQKLLDHHFLAGVTEAAGEHRLDVSSASAVDSAMTTPFARGQSARLHNDRQALALHVAADRNSRA
jgi:hypothetical protein